ncbi:MAG TPA: beta-N-acetylglucosaminidase domain-containing protein, partial [Jatrophihabitantaceae bacterium]|nr:beta-N-acetylglucosaminidase domain-containing protein [Jatrophihabitantaceae bacterium]
MFRCLRVLSISTATVLAASGLAAGGLVGNADAAPAGSHTAHPRLPAVYPTPQSMSGHGRAVDLGSRVALVAGNDSDPSAVAAARTVLTSAGVRHIDAAPTHGGETAIFVGGAGARAAAGRLHVADAAELPAEGYVLATGTAHGHPAVVLDGHDATGTFYAAQTLRQLVERHGYDARVPGVTIRDWPDQPLRGVIEGFYGTPWSDAQRLAQMDFYGAHKMNSYVYSPKDDPYLRAQWRDPYPADQLAVLKNLVARATANHVQFTYALSPGLSVCYSSAVDEHALVAKFQSLWDIGVRSFSVPLDDISY